MPFDTRTSGGNSKTLVINRIMHGNRKRYKTERHVSEPGFRITPVYSPPGIGLQFIRALLVSTVHVLEGVSAHSPQVLMGSGFVIVSTWEWMAACAFPCCVTPGWPTPASLKTRCPGWSAPREGWSTHIYGSPYASDILTISTQHRCLFLYCKWRRAHIFAGFTGQCPKRRFIKEKFTYLFYLSGNVFFVFFTDNYITDFYSPSFFMQIVI